ncbi:Slp family lipoprotein [Dyella sp.]|uniref:Slp family lipoprotein n=1 Tax=Dyella sp. TaxID=1869338 RepID=UPI002D78111D|nr:Slp family lipoprotein [Dyella sp.]HET6432203.1 Slp family lipoprotein [Dyella sp.]
MRPVRFLAPLLAPAAMLALAACAPAPIYKPSTDAVAAVPFEVARSPERFANGSVIWGGRVVAVNNLADHSEIEVLAYPLDKSQRPKVSDSGNGRFIAVIKGFVEPMAYPDGALITVSGKLDGSRAGRVGAADYVFPLVQVDQAHAWTAEEMRSGHSNVHFGVGLGVGIR